MLRKIGLVLMVSSGLMLAGCGGGSTDDSSGVQSRQTVAGPLTPVQNTLSTSVLQPLAQATAGTPLSGVVSCADFAVNGDALNIVNALANGIQGATQNPQAIANVAPQVQAQVQQLVADLQQLLQRPPGDERRALHPDPHVRAREEQRGRDREHRELDQPEQAPTDVEPDGGADERPTPPGQHRSRFGIEVSGRGSRGRARCRGSR